MLTRKMFIPVMFIAVLVLYASPASAQVPHIVSTSPTQNELNVSVSTNISVVFDADMDESTINSSSFIVNARSTGVHQGTFSYDDQTYTTTLDPNEDFEVGEVVTVVLTTGIETLEGTPLEIGHAWSFTVEALYGTGSFGPPWDYEVGYGPMSVSVADLDNDGDLDVATANGFSGEYGSCGASVLLNNGDGTFASHADYPAGLYPMAVVAADFDGDGFIDLAVAFSETTVNPSDATGVEGALDMSAGVGDVAILLNNGDGSFAPYSAYPVDSSPSDVFAADLDGDGDFDLVTTNASVDNVSVLLNDGDGTFAPHMVYSVGEWPMSVYAADLDDDGDLDLATANQSSVYVSILLNSGDGTFTTHLVYSVDGGTQSIFAADLDGDGDLDLAATKHSDRVSVLLNDGNGAFPSYSDYQVGEDPEGVFAADLDADGDIDLVTPNLLSNDISILLNNGNATFAPHVDYSLGDYSYPCGVFAADLDGDSDLDLTIGRCSVVNNDVYVMMNAVTRGDVTGDGVIDLGDVLYLISYLYKGGPAPDPFEAGDVDCSGEIELGDVLYLISYLYKGGPAPDC